MKRSNLKGSLILCLAALLWGLAFVVQASAAAVPAFTFNGIRSYVGAIFLLIVWKLFLNNDKTSFFPKEKRDRKKYYKAALVCGVCLSVSMNLQQFGIKLYPKDVAIEARSGFITALYVILVPIISVFLKKKINVFVGLGGIIAMAGIYVLCLSSGLGGIYLGDILTFCCAISFAVHILSIDAFVGITGGVKLSIMQFFVAATVSMVLSCIFDTVSMTAIVDTIPEILYMGIFSSGIAYTLQIIGQKYAEPAVASITMSLESVFAALGGVIISGRFLKSYEIIGCALVFAAIIVAQIPEFLNKNKSTN